MTIQHYKVTSWKFFCELRWIKTLASINHNLKLKWKPKRSKKSSWHQNDVRITPKWLLKIIFRSVMIIILLTLFLRYYDLLFCLEKNHYTVLLLVVYRSRLSPLLFTGLLKVNSYVQSLHLLQSRFYCALYNVIYW